MTISKLIPLRAGQNSKPSPCAMTLVEMIVAVGVGSLVLLSMGMIFATSSRSFVFMGSFMNLDRTNRYAMDVMSRDIRRSKDLISFATNQLVFSYDGKNTNLTYIYDSSAGTLSSFKTGDSSTNVLLSGLDRLSFSMYANAPLAGASFSNTTTATRGKSISVTWCNSKTIVGQKLTREDMQEALIVIRNKKVH
jgi:hypothetical protein